MGKSVLQDWVTELPLMQQSVLLSAMRNADGVRKGHPQKGLVRWYRRCVVISAFDGRVIYNPWELGGGSYAGPSIPAVRKLTPDEWPGLMVPIVDAFIDARDEMNLHYFAHTMHAFQILGYKHPDDVIRRFWLHVYIRMVECLHLWPEDMEAMNLRLGDNEAGWQARSDPSTVCED